MHTFESDKIVLDEIAQGSSDALMLLYDRYSQTIYQLILRIVHDGTVADELLQETFWTVWQKAEQYDSTGSVAAWLSRIARNKSLDELRRQKARPRPSLAHDSDENQTRLEAEPDHAIKVEETVANNWLRHQVQTALAELPEEQRMCLELAYFNGMTQREIASHTDVSVGTVKTRVRLGLEKLERLLRTLQQTSEVT